jgi:hypothetical protein
VEGGYTGCGGGAGEHQEPHAHPRGCLARPRVAYNGLTTHGHGMEVMRRGDHATSVIEGSGEMVR